MGSRYAVLGIGLMLVLSTMATPVGGTDGEQREWRTSTEIRTVLEEPSDIELTNADEDGVNHLFWRSERHGTAGELYHAPLAADGSLAGPAQRITTAPGDTRDPTAVVHDGTVHVFFIDDRDRRSKVFHAAIEDGSVTVEPHPVTTGGGELAVAASNGRLHLLIARPDLPEGIPAVSRVPDDGEAFGGLSYYLLDESGSVVNSKRLRSGYVSPTVDEDYGHRVLAVTDVVAASGDGSVYTVWTLDLWRESAIGEPNGAFQTFVKFARIDLSGGTISVDDVREVASGKDDFVEGNSLDGITKSLIDLTGMAYANGDIHLTLRERPRPDRETDYFSADHLNRFGYFRLSTDGRRWSALRRYAGWLVSDGSRVFVDTDRRYSGGRVLVRQTGSEFAGVAASPSEAVARAVNADGGVTVVHRSGEGSYTVSSLASGEPDPSVPAVPSEPPTTTTTRTTATTAATTPPTTTTTATVTTPPTVDPAETTRADSDGDGVPDEADYAPDDPSVQEREGLAGGGTSDGFGPGFGAPLTLVALVAGTLALLRRA